MQNIKQSQQHLISQEPIKKYYTRFKCLNPQAINSKIALKKVNDNLNNNAKIMSKSRLNFDFLSEDQSLLISKQFSKISKDKNQVTFQPNQQKISVFQILSKQSLNIPSYQKQNQRNQNVEKILLDTLIEIKLQTQSHLEYNKRIYNQLLLKSQIQEKKKLKNKSNSSKKFITSDSKSYSLNRSSIKSRKSYNGCNSNSLCKLYKTTKF